MRKLFCSGAAVAALGLLMAVHAQPPPQGKAAPQNSSKSDAPKNLKILTAGAYKQAMQGFVTELGLTDKGGCNFCHEADRASDLKMEKVMARVMLQMVNNINAQTFKGEQKVTCYTCHRGSPRPLPAP